MTLDELVDEVLDQHRFEIEQLVERRFRRRIVELARSLVGAEVVELAELPVESSNGHAASARVCATCRARPALAGRRDCGACKSRRQRERAQETAPPAISGADDLDADPAHVAREGPADDAASAAAPMLSAPDTEENVHTFLGVERPRTRLRTGSRLVSDGEREAARERAELIASVEPEVELDGAGRAWRVRRLPAAPAPPPASSFGDEGEHATIAAHLRAGSPVAAD